MNDGDDDFLGVAYHEAGHAVVALAFGLWVARVEIFPEDHSGATDVEPADHLPIEDRIALCVGGMNANDMFNAPMHDLATFGDHVLVLKLIKNADDADGDVLRDKGHQRA
jgi:hypothetical protein